MFFAILIGAFALGQAGPNLEGLFTAAGAAGSIFETIDRVSWVSHINMYVNVHVHVVYMLASLVHLH